MARIAGFTSVVEDIEVADDVTVTGLLAANGTVSIGASMVQIGTTLSGRIGFHGKTPTSQPSGSAQTTVSIALGFMSISAMIGFSNTTTPQLIVTQLAEIQRVLTDNGLWKGGA